jgi:pyruvate kinase
VIPILYSEESTDDAKIAYAIEQGRRRGILESGDSVIVTSGHTQMTGATNLIRVMMVQ